MKSLILGLVLMGASAFATTVTFDTNNAGTSFSCIGYSGGGTCTASGDTVRVDDIVLTYTPNSASVTAPPATSIGAGDINASCFTGANGCTVAANFTGVAFSLDIKETGVVTGDALFSAALSGSATFSNSGIRVLLVPSSQTLTTGATSVSFTPDQPSLGYSLNPPSDVKTTTLQMIVNSSTRETTPEPSSMALLASGLVGLGLFARRKK